MNKLLSLLLSAIVSFVFIGCSGQGTAVESALAENAEVSRSEENQKSGAPLVVRVGDQPTFFLLKIAEQKGFFAEEFGIDQITIEVNNFVKAGPAILEAMATNELDLAIVGTLPIVTANVNNNKVIALASANYTENGFGLFVTKQSGITTAEELRGKVVAAPFGTNEHQMLVKVLKNANIPLEDVQITNMSASDSLNAFLSNQIDGAVFRGFQSSEATKAGGLLLVDNSETGLIVNCVVGREGFIKQYPEVTARFLKVMDRTQKYIEDNQEETIQIVADLTDTSVEDTKVNFDARKRLIDIDQAHFVEPIESALQFVYEEGLVDTRLTFDDVADTTYYKIWKEGKE